MAAVLDVSVGYFDRDVRPFARPEHVRKDGRKLLFYSRGVLDAWYEARLRPMPGPDEVDELMLQSMFLGLPLLDTELG